MITYSRLVPADADRYVVDATVQHIIEHVLSVADPNDDPTAHGGEVLVERREQDDGVLLVGSLDAEPQADYLRPGYDPYDGVPADLRAEVGR
jgi:hypothetical protein